MNGRGKTCTVAAAIGYAFVLAVIPVCASAAEPSIDANQKRLPERLLGFETLAGKAAHGRQLLESDHLDCQACHSLERDGQSVGPSLFDVGQRLGFDELVESVINPSAAYAPGHKPIMIVLKDKSELRGVELSADVQSVTLLTDDGAQTTIDRSEIAFIQIGRSPMPAGLVDHLTAQEFADLIEFLVRLRRSGKPSRPSAADQGAMEAEKTRR